MERTQQLQGKQISGAIPRAPGFFCSWQSPAEPCPTGSGLHPPALHPLAQRKQLELSWRRFTLAMFPVLPCTLALLPALFQHRLHAGFQDLLLLRDLFVPAELSSSCLGCR